MATQRGAGGWGGWGGGVGGEVFQRSRLSVLLLLLQQSFLSSPLGICCHFPLRFTHLCSSQAFMWACDSERGRANHDLA